MPFHSISFVLFLLLTFALYWISNKRLSLQNLVVVVASYTFYGWWDWRFLSLIFVSTVVDYLVGIGLAKSNKTAYRKRLLWLSIIVNLGLLGFFKYYHFFVDNFILAFASLGLQLTPTTLHIILPIGISFYTFQTLSYSIDVYHKKIQPTSNFLAFAAFVSFFPQLVAGPIERASHLLPQFLQQRQFQYHQAVEGLKQFLWGLVKKVIVADQCAEYADLIFAHPGRYSGSTLVLGAVFFSFQIYGDFSGYSDMAIGTSRLFGFDLKRNFAFPYFSRSIPEFWRRWHISLSTWFRDYVYIPLGGSRGSTWLTARNILLVFLISGFWHGASWKFVIWGGIHALLFLAYFIFQQHKNHQQIVAIDRAYPTLKELIQMLVTFGLVTLAWIFFRAENLSAALHYLSGIGTTSLFSIPEIRPSNLLALLILFVIMEWTGRKSHYAIEHLAADSSRVTRWGFYMIICFSILLFHGKEQPFIYFQF